MQGPGVASLLRLLEAQAISGIFFSRSPKQGKHPQEAIPAYVRQSPDGFSKNIGRDEGPQALPFQVLLAGPFQVAAYIRGWAESLDESIKSDSRTNVLNDISLRPYASFA